MNKSVGDCSISLKLRTDFNHVTHDVPQTFKVNRSEVKVTALYNVTVTVTICVAFYRPALRPPMGPMRNPILNQKITEIS